MGRNDISPRYSSYLSAFLLPPTSSDSREPSAGQMMSFIDKLTACPPTDTPCHRPFTVTAGGLIKAVEMFKQKKNPIVFDREQSHPLPSKRENTSQMMQITFLLREIQSAFAVMENIFICWPPALSTELCRPYLPGLVGLRVDKNQKERGEDPTVTAAAAFLLEQRGCFYGALDPGETWINSGSKMEEMESDRCLRAG